MDKFYIKAAKKLLGNDYILPKRNHIINKIVINEGIKDEVQDLALQLQLIAELEMELKKLERQLNKAS
jgi:ribosomal protein L5